MLAGSRFPRMDGRGRRRGVEWPSIALCGGVYGGWLAVTFFSAAMSPVVVAALCSLLVTLHSSMQHEFIHGHPTPWRRLNRALGFVPLSIWLPFESYRLSHLVHHCDEHLTDPFDDPESFYWTAAGWATLPGVGRAFLLIHSTLAGRLVLGPALAIATFLIGQGRKVRDGDGATRRIWAWHLVGVAGVTGWLVAVCGISLPFYLCGVVYPAMAVALLRSFAEHRAEAEVIERTAIVENAPLLGFLFLFNNLHAAHHERPLVPWYELPDWYKIHRDRLLAENGGLVYDGYADVARRFLFKPHHVPVHPAQPAVAPVPAPFRSLAVRFAPRRPGPRRSLAPLLRKFGEDRAKQVRRRRFRDTITSTRL